MTMVLIMKATMTMATMTIGNADNGDGEDGNDDNGASNDGDHDDRLTMTKFMVMMAKGKTMMIMLM